MTPLIDPAELPVPQAAGGSADLAGPATTAGPATNAVPVVRALPDGECVYADALPLAEITFAQGTRLYGADIDGLTVRCLADLPADARGPIIWSPIANRAVIGPSTVFDVAGSRASGFDASALPAGVRLVWEFPVGDALLGPSADGARLIRRSAATGAPTELGFLATTTRVVSHPSGRLVIAAGTAADGASGIFAAEIVGTVVRTVTPLVLFGDPDTVVAELAIDGTGDTVLAAVGSRSAQELMRIALVDLAVRGLASSAEPISSLTTGASTTTVAWATGLCNSQTRTWAIEPRTGTPVPVGAGGPLETRSVAPVAWVDPVRLLVASRTFGCDGPADLWIWNALDTTLVLFARGVERPALRKLLPSAPAVAVAATGTASVL